MTEAAMTEAQMKPCPFCGDPAKIETHEAAKAVTTYFGACSNDACMVDGPMAADPATAIERWNRRA